MPLDPSRVLLTDRVVLVTGAAVGIGEAVARTCARFGADVAVCDRDATNLESTVQAIEAAGRRAWSGIFDVREGEAVRRFVAQVGDDAGHIDVLVNNVGGGFQADFLAVGDKGQDALVHENFTSATHCIRAVVPRMPESGGSIINITSIEAHRGAPGFAIYSAMKAALTSLTQSLALELGARRIRVNCVAPDVIPTPGIGSPSVDTPLPDPGDVDDVAGAVIYLASDLSRFVTGSVIHVDGGNAAAGGWRRNAQGRFEA